MIFFTYSTFVCPTEIISFNDRLSDFERLNCQVLGISVDSEFSHLAWTKMPRSQGGLGAIKLPLLSDLTKSISKDYGVLLESGISLRGLFILDPNGKVRQSTVNDLPIGRSVDETLRVLQAIQHFDTHGEVCPANWTKGSRTVFLQLNSRSFPTQKTLPNILSKISRNKFKLDSLATFVGHDSLVSMDGLQQQNRQRMEQLQIKVKEHKKNNPYWRKFEIHPSFKQFQLKEKDFERIDPVSKDSIPGSIDSCLLRLDELFQSSFLSTNAISFLSRAVLPFAILQSNLPSSFFVLLKRISLHHPLIFADGFLLPLFCSYANLTALHSQTLLLALGLNPILQKECLMQIILSKSFTPAVCEFIVKISFNKIDDQILSAIFSKIQSSSCNMDNLLLFLSRSPIVQNNLDYKRILRSLSAKASSDFVKRQLQMLP